MPMEVVDRIQLVRDTGSLQYGAQFGGMLNYITKSADTTKAISFESVNSAGSFGLLSTYNAVGGRIGKVDYYAYVNKRVSTGYRDNSRTDSDAEAVMITYRPTEMLNLRFELSHSKYIYQLPGALSDNQFHEDPRQSTRSRNYYSPDIYIPSIGLDWKLGNRTKLSWLTSAVLGTRKSVMFDKPADVRDVIDPVTLTYAQRQVDIDEYNSYTTEIRLLHEYDLLNQSSALVAGIQLMNNDLHRHQQGKGTTGSDYDPSLTEPGWGVICISRQKILRSSLKIILSLQKGFSQVPVSGRKLENPTLADLLHTIRRSNFQTPSNINLCLGELTFNIRFLTIRICMQDGRKLIVQ